MDDSSQYYLPCNGYLWILLLDYYSCREEHEIKNYDGIAHSNYSHVWNLLAHHMFLTKTIESETAEYVGESVDR